MLAETCCITSNIARHAEPGLTTSLEMTAALSSFHKFCCFRHTSMYLHPTHPLLLPVLFCSSTTHVKPAPRCYASHVQQPQLHATQLQ